MLNKAYLVENMADEIFKNCGLSFLSLDVSLSSTGITYLKHGDVEAGNISLSDVEENDFYEAVLRRELKNRILEKVGRGTYFDVIIVEDVFVGTNPKTARVLYALNSAIDELILDREIECSDFVRWQNGTWKKYLWMYDVEGDTKYIKDKLRIEQVLFNLGITDFGEGYQDRLDSVGMVLAYLMRNACERKEKPVKLSDLMFVYGGLDKVISDVSALGVGNDEIVYWNEEIITESKLLDFMNKNKGFVVVTSRPVKLGILGERLKLGYVKDGYLAVKVRD